MKRLIIFIALLTACIYAQAQTRVWLSGYHANASIRYLYDGEYSTIDVVWEGGTPVNNANVVVYGQFKQSASGAGYFAIEKSAKSVTRYSGSYKKASYLCPATSNEGQIITSSGSKISYASFVPLNAEGYVDVTEAEWGIKVCKGVMHSIYYIRKINGNAGQQVVQQVVVNPSTGNPTGTEARASARITGKVISLEKAPELNVRNYAQILQEDGTTREISSSRLMKVGERVTLDGYYKTVYWDGVMKTSEIFFVTKMSN